MTEKKLSPMMTALTELGWQKAVDGRITVEDGYTGSTVTLDATHALEIDGDMVKLSVVGKPHLIRWVGFKKEKGND